MSKHLARDACARARVEAAERWVMANPPTGAPLSDRLDAFIAGAVQANEDAAIEAAVGQRQLDNAARVIRDAASLFRQYEQRDRESMLHEQPHAVNADLTEAINAKYSRAADRNRSMAARLEAWLRNPYDPDGDEDHGVFKADLPGIVPLEAARRIADRDLASLKSNLRPVVTGPLSDPDVVEGIMAATGMVRGRTALTHASDGVFHLTTADPRFDPAAPIHVNGFPFNPATTEK